MIRPWGDRMRDLLDRLLRQLLVSAGRADVAVKVQVETGAQPPEITSVIGLMVAEAAFAAVKIRLRRSVWPQRWLSACARPASTVHGR